MIVLFYNSTLTVQYVCVVGVQVLEARRAQCEHKDQDPVVWTCHRVIKWIRDIDLKVGPFPSTETSECTWIPFRLSPFWTNRLMYTLDPVREV